MEMMMKDLLSVGLDYITWVVTTKLAGMAVLESLGA